MKIEMMKTWCLVSLGLGIFTFAHGGELTLQNGVNDYNGAVDAALVGEIERQETLNYGHSEILEVAGVAVGGKKRLALIRFSDLTGPGRLPAGTIITKATLRLYKVGEPEDVGQYQKSQPNQLFIMAYPLLTSWKAGMGDATVEGEGVMFAFRGYKMNGAPEFWGEQERPETGPVKDVDYNASRYSRSPLQVGENDIWMEWDVTEFVQEWMDVPANNHGLLLSARGYYIGAYFASCEAVDPDYRPALDIFW